MVPLGCCSQCLQNTEAVNETTRCVKIGVTLNTKLHNTTHAFKAQYVPTENHEFYRSEVLGDKVWSTAVILPLVAVHVAVVATCRTTTLGGCDLKIRVQVLRPAFTSPCESTRK